MLSAIHSAEATASRNDAAMMIASSVFAEAASSAPAFDSSAIRTLISAM